MPGISNQPKTTRRLLAGVSAFALAAVLGASASNTWPVAPARASTAAEIAPVQGGPDFADLVARVRPAVVSVRVKIRQHADPTAFRGQSPKDDGNNPFQDNPFNKFFKRFGQGQGDNGTQGNNSDSGPLAHAEGSGFFVSSEGYIVTNNHVVNGAMNVQVILDSGKTLPAKIIGTDPKTDLAVIKVDGANFPFVHLASSEPRVGEWVLAMGNPFGLGGTVTAGIVSAEGRDIGSGPYDNYIQIDAPVNKGNSGGPTFNLKGEVIGVNTAIFSPSGGSVGVAFDVPAITVASIIPQLEANGKIDRAWLGVQIQPVTADIADSMGLPSAKGALIAEPQDGSPGAKAGLKAGDVITAVNGNEVPDARDLAVKIGGMKPGSIAKLTVIRDGKTDTIDVTLGQLSDGKVQKAAIDHNGSGGDKLGSLGLEVMPATSVHGAGSLGVAVTSVDQSGKGADLGFAIGDVILKVGDKSVSNTADLKTAMKDEKASGKKTALFLVKRNNEQRFVAVPVAVS